MKVFAGILLLVAVLFTILYQTVGVKSMERRAECEKKGGIYYTPRDRSLCIRRDSVIEIAP